MLHSLYFANRWRLAFFGMMNTLVHLFICFALHISFATIFLMLLFLLLLLLNSICCPLKIVPFIELIHRILLLIILEKIMARKAPTQYSHFHLNLYSFFSVCACTRCSLCFVLRKIVLPLLFVVFFFFCNFGWLNACGVTTINKYTPKRWNIVWRR